MQFNFTRDLVITAALAASLSVTSVARAVPTDDPAAPQVIATASESSGAPCFSRREWNGGWKSAPDARAIYIRVGRSVYRLDLQASYSLLKDPFAVLSNTGSGTQICTPLDFRLAVSNRAGVQQWPIVSRMTQLTPEEVKALPRKLRP